MYSVKIDKDGFYTGTYAKLLNEINPFEDGICVDTIPQTSTYLNCYKLIRLTNIDDEDTFVWQLDEDKMNAIKDEEILSSIRAQREKMFEIIDFFQLVLVYNELTDEQKSELAQFRIDWLDAPQTKVIPEIPEWIYNIYKK